MGFFCRGACIFCGSRNSEWEVAVRLFKDSTESKEGLRPLRVTQEMEKDQSLLGVLRTPGPLHSEAQASGRCT